LMACGFSLSNFGSSIPFLVVYGGSRRGDL